jgi:hypothetical protein
MTNILFFAPLDIQKLYFSHLSTENLCSAASTSKSFYRLVQDTVKDRLKNLSEFWESHYTAQGQTLGRALMNKIKKMEAARCSTQQLMAILRLNHLILDCLRSSQSMPSPPWPKVIKELKDETPELNADFILKEFAKIVMTASMQDFSSVLNYNPVAFTTLLNARRFRFLCANINGGISLHSIYITADFSFSSCYKTYLESPLPFQKPEPCMAIQEALEQDRYCYVSPRPEAEEPPSKSLKLNLKNEKL